MTTIEAVCKALCQSRKFETGEGTCSFLCMDQLGDARKACPHRNAIYKDLAIKIIDEVNRAANHRTVRYSCIHCGAINPSAYRTKSALRQRVFDFIRDNPGMTTHQIYHVCYAHPATPAEEANTIRCMIRLLNAELIDVGMHIQSFAKAGGGYVLNVYQPRGPQE